MSLWLPCGLHGFAVPNTVTVTVYCCVFRYGVLFATIISWIPGTSVSYLTAALPGGEDRFEYFKRVSSNQPQRLHRSTNVARYIKCLSRHCIAKGRPRVEPHLFLCLCTCARL